VVCSLPIASIDPVISIWVKALASDRRDGIEFT